METVNTPPKSLPSFLLKPAERILNASFSADPTALTMLRELDGRKISVELDDLSLITGVVIAGDRIILDDDALVPDAEVSGRLASLLGAARSGTARGLNVNGDAEVVQGLARAMSRLPGATWERIACTIGDVPARGLERFARGVLELVEGTGERLGGNLSEYLQYELRAVASRAEVEDFLGEVDTLRSDAERLAKRIERLARRAL
jgi:ubiquinone biosynthesis protein UbiJ